MDLQFYKYQGAGNDFVLIDNRTNVFDVDKIEESKIAKLCDRHFGIGADGLMFLEKSDKFDFGMRYFNSDGAESTMCGNGGRCITAFAANLGIIKSKAHFVAIDGEHFSEIENDGLVNLKMVDVNGVERNDEYFFLNTGSPHYVQFVKNVMHFDVFNEGKKIRHLERFAPKGTNVNFVEVVGDSIFVRTFERGVEDETLACGTGSVASAICFHLLSQTEKKQATVFVKTLGGNLEVSFKAASLQNFNDVWLKGPATFVFAGQIEF